MEPTAQQHDDLIGPSEVAKILGVSTAWVRDHVTRRSPRLPVIRLGNRRAILRFRRMDIYRFIEQQRVDGDGAASIL